MRSPVAAMRRLGAGWRRLRGGGDESALVVLVPEAEPAVGDLRARLDPAASMPAHLTVLYPFVPPAAISEGDLDRLRGLFERQPPFDFTLSAVRWFDDRVVYLAPEPPEPFVALTAAVTSAFPRYRPYRGAFPDVIPHVCVAEGAPASDMQEAAGVVVSRLPIRSRADEVVLMAHRGATDVWDTVVTFPLVGREGFEPP